MGDGMAVELEADLNADPTDEFVTKGERKGAAGHEWTYNCCGGYFTGHSPKIGSGFVSNRDPKGSYRKKKRIPFEIGILTRPSHQAIGQIKFSRWMIQHEKRRHLQLKSPTMKTTKTKTLT
jgi:hypothetical protein